MRGSDCTKKCMKRGREFPYLTWLLCHWLWLIRYPKLTKAQPAHYLTEKSGGKYELLQEVAQIFLVETSFFWVALVPLLQLSVRSVYWHWKYSDEFWNTDTVKRSEATFYILALNMVKIVLVPSTKKSRHLCKCVKCLCNPPGISSIQKRSVTVQNATEHTYSLALIFLNRWLKQIFDFCYSFLPYLSQEMWKVLNWLHFKCYQSWELQGLKIDLYKPWYNFLVIDEINI